ncbi:MAG: hypothetical protein WKG07_19015 [Hymenobacter sp.]
MVAAEGRATTISYSPSAVTAHTAGGPAAKRACAWRCSTKP